MQLDLNKKTVQTVCGICSASCGMQLHFEDDKLIAVEGDKQHPGSQGYLCPKGKALVEMINSPERIRFPLKKTEQQGWQRISWSEALQLIAEKLDILKNESDAQALAVHIGQAGIDKQFKSYAELFARVYGTPNFSTVCSHCHLSRTMASQYTFGFHPQPDFANSNCIVLWGANPAVSNPPSLSSIKTALKNGGQLIVVDPRSTQLTSQASLHLQVRPGSDDALALAFIKLIIDAGLYDKEFVKTWTIGMEPLQELVSSYSLKELSGITGVAVDQIEAAARLYAGSAPACIAVGNAVELHQNGFQAARAIAILQALTGNLDIKGGERFIPEFLKPLAIVPSGSTIPAIGQEDYPLFFKYSGHAQANKYARAIICAQPYKIRSMIIAGSNPLLTWPDTKQVHAAMSQLEFLVVMDHFMTETAQLADLVLPAASFLGSYEIWEGIDAEGRLVVGLAEPVLDEGECRSNWWFWQALAAEMGYAATYPWADEAQALDMRLQARGLSLKQLSQHPNGLVYGQWAGYQYLEQEFTTPSGKVELYSQPIEAAGYPPIPLYMQTSSIDSEEKDYPFVLSSGARTYGYMHSRFRNLASLRKLNPEPLLEMNPFKASELGIEAEDMVKLESKQGELKIKVKYNPQLNREVLLMPHGWDEANANLLSATVDLDPVTGYPSDRSIMVRVSKC